MIFAKTHEPHERFSDSLATSVHLSLARATFRSSFHIHTRRRCMRPSLDAADGGRSNPIVTFCGYLPYG